MGDKIQRLVSVINNGIYLVNTESLRDTLIDLHNYSAMAIMLLDEKKTKFGEEKCSYTKTNKKVKTNFGDLIVTSTEENVDLGLRAYTLFFGFAFKGKRLWRNKSIFYRNKKVIYTIAINGNDIW